MTFGDIIVLTIAPVSLAVADVLLKLVPPEGARFFSPNEKAESTAAVVSAADRLGKRFSHLPKPDGINTRIEVRDRLNGNIDYIPSIAAAGRK